MKHLNTYNNSVIANDSLSLNEKDNISSFISKVFNKLLSNLDMNNSNDDNLTYSSGMNIIDYDAPDNHPIIVNQNTVAGLDAKNYKGDTSKVAAYPPGYINPLNVKSIRRSLNIDTRFRDNYLDTRSTDFIVDIPETFKKVVKMKLTSFEIPSTIYTISELNKNNFFYYDISNDSSSGKTILKLEDGNYSIPTNTQNNFNDNDIEQIIKKELEDRSDNLKFTINKINGKSKFSSSEKFTLYFNDNNNDTEKDLETLSILKLGWLLGFRLGQYNASNTNTPDGSYVVQSEGICVMNTPQYLYLSINDFTNAANNHFVAAFNNSILSPHILASINYQSLLRDSGIYSYSNSINNDVEEEDRIRRYFGPVDIKRLQVQILDEYGNVIDLNNMDWSFTLSLELLYN